MDPAVGRVPIRIRRGASAQTFFAEFVDIRRHRRDEQAPGRGRISRGRADDRIDLRPDSLPARIASATTGNDTTSFELSNARRAARFDVPPNLARCSPAERAPARFQSPASSTRAASRTFALDAIRSMRSNADHTSVTSRLETASGSSPPTIAANARSKICIVAEVTGVRRSSVTATSTP